MNDVAQFSLWGIGGAALTALLMQLLKRLTTDDEGNTPIKDRWAVAGSVLVGISLSTLAYAAQLWPGIVPIVEVVGGGLLAGLAAAGLYSFTKRR